MHKRTMTFEAPCRSAALHGKAQKNFKAALHGGCARLDGVRLSPLVILCGFAACLSVSKAIIDSNATYCTLAVEYQSLSRRYRRRPRRRQHNAGNMGDGEAAVGTQCFIGVGVSRLGLAPPLTCKSSNRRQGAICLPAGNCHSGIQTP